MRTLILRKQLLELSEGDEAGIKSAMLEVAGRYAYGFLLAEKGTHRLVRLSPFNAKAARQTSFAGVEVMPMLAESAAAAAVLPEEDVEIIFTRSGGKGGQNVNKVETAVRVRHLPTGLFVKCTQERCVLVGLASILHMHSRRNGRERNVAGEHMHSSEPLRCMCAQVASPKQGEGARDFKGKTSGHRGRAARHGHRRHTGRHRQGGVGTADSQLCAASLQAGKGRAH